MVARFGLGLILAVGAAGTAYAADPVTAKPDSASGPVPGARVSVEGGVRVIRPALPASGSDGLQQAGTSGSLIYRGAAFYRVPSAALPANERGDGEQDKDPAPSKPAQ